jgi:hypothetical protein
MQGCTDYIMGKDFRFSQRAECQAATFLTKSFPDEVVYHSGDYAPFTLCSDRQRPDIILDVCQKKGRFIIEIEEHAHMSYDNHCEMVKVIRHF